MKVGFIGLGDIGMPMASRLVQNGFQVIASDVDSNKIEVARSNGLTIADHYSDFRPCTVVGLAVPDDHAVELVLFEGELLDVLTPGSAVLVHSTILPETAKRLSQIASRQGVAIFDAPVSGGAARAASGELAIMVGGDTSACPDVAQVLAALASTTHFVGPPGAGAAVKLANQLAMLSVLAAMYEGLALAEHYGASTEATLEALQSGTGASWVADNWGFFDTLVAKYDTARTPRNLRPWSKDLWDVVATARAAQIEVPLAGLLSQYLAARVEDHAHNDNHVR